MRLNRLRFRTACIVAFILLATLNARLPAQDRVDPKMQALRDRWAKAVDDVIAPHVDHFETNVWRSGILGELELDAVDALSATVESFHALDDWTQKNVISWLQSLGPDAEPAIPVLTAVLADSGTRGLPYDPFEAGECGDLAAYALAAIGPAAVPALRRSLHDEKPRARMNAALTLGLLGDAARPAVPDLIRALDDEKYFVRRDAAGALGDIGEQSPRVVQALLALLDKEENIQVRMDATRVLGKVGLSDEAGFAKLLDLLRSDEPPVQLNVVRALAECKENRNAAIAALRTAIRIDAGYVHKSSDRPIATECAKTLGRLGPASAAALPELLETAEKKDRTFREYFTGDIEDDHWTSIAAMEAAAGIAPQDRRTIAMLAGCVEKDHNRQAAARALARIGPAAEAALPELLELLRSDGLKREDRLWIGVALLRVRPQLGESAYRAVKESLVGDDVGEIDSDEWKLIIQSLRAAGLDTTEIRDAMIWSGLNPRKSSEESPYPFIIRCNFEDVISEFGMDAAPAIPLMIEEMNCIGRHDWLIPLLRKITAGNHPLITKALDNPNTCIRAGAALVLGANDKAVPLLAKALDDPSARVRLAAVKSLAEIFGRGIAEAKGPLEKALKDKRKSIRVVAEGALAGGSQ